MELFSKDKELVLKLINAALIIWFLAATVISFTILLDILMPDKIDTFEEYQITNCVDDENYKPSFSCEIRYQEHKKYEENNRRQEIQSFIGGLFNMAVVGTTIYVLNRKPVKAKKK